jgi:cobalamin synthase
MPLSSDAAGAPGADLSAGSPRPGRTSARTARLVGTGMMVAGLALLALYLPPPLSAIAVIVLFAAAVLWGRRELKKKSARAAETP